MFAYILFFNIRNIYLHRKRKRRTEKGMSSHIKFLASHVYLEMCIISKTKTKILLTRYPDSDTFQLENHLCSLQQADAMRGVSIVTKPLDSRDLDIQDRIINFMKNLFSPYYTPYRISIQAFKFHSPFIKILIRK